MVINNVELRGGDSTWKGVKSTNKGREESEGVYFIAITCDEWLSLFERINGYDMGYQGFDHLTFIASLEIGQEKEKYNEIITRWALSEYLNNPNFNLLKTYNYETIQSHSFFNGTFLFLFTKATAERTPKSATPRGHV